MVQTRHSAPRSSGSMGVQVPLGLRQAGRAPAAPRNQPPGRALPCAWTAIGGEGAGRPRSGEAGCPSARRRAQRRPGVAQGPDEPAPAKIRCSTGAESWLGILERRRSLGRSASRPRSEPLAPAAVRRRAHDYDPARLPHVGLTDMGERSHALSADDIIKRQAAPSSGATWCATAGMRR